MQERNLIGADVCDPSIPNRNPATFLVSEVGYLFCQVSSDPNHFQATSPSETATGSTNDLSGDIEQQTLQPVQQLIEKVNKMDKHQEPRRFAPANNMDP